MAELARKNDAALLFASTSEVYGDAEVVPTPESYWGKVNPVGPRSCYDEGKRFAEALLMAYGKQYGLDVRVPRIFIPMVRVCERMDCMAGLCRVLFCRQRLISP